MPGIFSAQKRNKRAKKNVRRECRLPFFAPHQDHKASPKITCLCDFRIFLRRAEKPSNVLLFRLPPPPRSTFIMQCNSCGLEFSPPNPWITIFLLSLSLRGDVYRLKPYTDAHTHAPTKNEKPWATRTTTHLQLHRRRRHYMFARVSIYFILWRFIHLNMMGLLFYGWIIHRDQ